MPRLDPNFNPFDKSGEIFGEEMFRREAGYYISRLEQYAKSLPFFDKVIKKNPDDLRALIGRSRARAKATQYEGALQDINHALSLDPDELGVLAEKALNTYLCCEFEEGLVQNLRLMPKRKKPEVFSMGMMHCTVAIENCVGERTGRPLRDHFKIIRKLAWKHNYAAQKPFEPTPTGKSKKKKFRFLKKPQSEDIMEPVQPRRRKNKKKSHVSLDIKESLHSLPINLEPVPPYNQPFPFRPLQDYTSNIENFMAEKYLDKMYMDKVYLKQIRDEPGMDSPNVKGAKKLREIAKTCYKTVSYKQELLRTRRPFYFIKYQEARVSGALKDRQVLELEHKKRSIKKEADGILDSMLTAYKEKRLKDYLALVEKLKRCCDSKPKKLFPDKGTYMQAIYDTVCKAFYDIYRINPDQSMYEQNKRIYATLGILLSREPSSDSVLTQFKNVFIDYKKQILVFENRLKEASASEEICWFYHELSRLHLETRQFELARLYAKKCIQEATLINNEHWILNSAMQMCKSNVQQNNKNDARLDLQMALKSAEKLKDNGKILYLKQCMDVVDTIGFDDIFGAKELKRREDMIIQMMASSKMKDEVAHLFRQMAAMPTSRRMTVIPGVRVAGKDRKGSTKGRNMSILAHPVDSSTHSSIMEIKKTTSNVDQHQNIGVGLMNLIGPHL